VRLSVTLYGAEPKHFQETVEGLEPDTNLGPALKEKTDKACFNCLFGSVLRRTMKYADSKEYQSENRKAHNEAYKSPPISKDEMSNSLEMISGIVVQSRRRILKSLACFLILNRTLAIDLFSEITLSFWKHEQRFKNCLSIIRTVKPSWEGQGLDS
jgi:hypothetical protein